MLGSNFGSFGSAGGGVTPPFSFGNALLFDGVNDYVSFTSFAITSTTTLSCWFNYSGSGDGGNIYGLSSSANLSVRIVSPTQIRWYDGANNNWTVASMGAGWHHIMITRSGTDTRCYVDGVESSSGIRTSNPTNIDQIGRYYNGTIVPLNGALDEVAITTTYTATLADAVALYNSGFGSLATDTLSGVRRYYQFNSSSGTVAIDAGTDADNGTLNNFIGTYWIPHYPPRIFNNAIFPDGVNDDGELNSQIILGTSTDWVVSFWAKGSGSSNATNIVLSDRTSSGYYTYLRTGSTPYVRLSFGVNTTRHDWSDSGLSGWDDGDWHHVYFYNVGGDIHLVFDGVDYGDGAATTNQNGVRIRDLFYRQVTGGFHSNVAMDDFIAHEITGSVTQAQYLYNEGDGADPVAVLGATPMYWYKFDINNGDTTVPNDGTSGSNDLTLNNFSGTYIQAH